MVSEKTRQKILFNCENKYSFAEFLSRMSLYNWIWEWLLIVAQIFKKSTEKPEFAQKMCASFCRSKILIVSAKNFVIFRRNSSSQSVFFSQVLIVFFFKLAWCKCGRTGTRIVLLFLPIFGPSSFPYVLAISGLWSLIPKYRRNLCRTFHLK